MSDATTSSRPPISRSRPLDESFAARVTAEIDERQKWLKGQQTGVLGIEKVLQQSPMDHPKMSARSRMPLCFASTVESFRAFRDGRYDFVAAYREASANFRIGLLTVAFPRFSFQAVYTHLLTPATMLLPHQSWRRSARRRPPSRTSVRG